MYLFYTFYSPFICLYFLKLFSVTSVNMLITLVNSDLGIISALSIWGQLFTLNAYIGLDLNLNIVIHAGLSLLTFVLQYWVFVFWTRQKICGDWFEIKEREREKEWERNSIDTKKSKLYKFSLFKTLLWPFCLFSHYLLVR